MHILKPFLTFSNVFQYSNTCWESSIFVNRNCNLESREDQDMFFNDIDIYQGRGLQKNNYHADDSNAGEVRS